MLSEHRRFPFHFYWGISYSPPVTKGCATWTDSVISRLNRTMVALLNYESVALGHVSTLTLGVYFLLFVIFDINIVCIQKCFYFLSYDPKRRSK